jgi:hypothetical protein
MDKNLQPLDFDHLALAKALLVTQPVLRQRLVPLVDKKGSAGANKDDFNEDRAAALLTEVLRFLNLVACTGQRLTPAEIVDRAWHEFILCTRTYGEFCQRHFGRMVHHEPGGESDENRRQFKQTLRLYQQNFGPPPARFWHFASSPCGACQTD